MLRRVLVIITLLALVMAVASPTLADDKNQDKDTPRPGATVTPTATPNAAIASEDDEEAQAGPIGKAFQGIVVKVDGSNLIVKNAKSVSDLTVKTDGNTTYRWPKGIIKQTVGVTPGLKDFVPGDRVVVKLAAMPTKALDNLLARAIYLVPGQTFVHFTGEVSTVFNGSAIGVTNGSVVKTFAAIAGTPVRIGHQTTTLDNAKLAVGDKVTVVARANPAQGATNPTAYSIAVHGQNNGNGNADKEKGNPGVGQGKGQTGDDEDQNETETETDNGQNNGKALGHDKTNKNGKP